MSGYGSGCNTSSNTTAPTPLDQKGLARVTQPQPLVEMGSGKHFFAQIDLEV
jgi:hypothetical protein